MKKQYLLLILLFLGIKLNAQNCNFTYIATPGSTLVDFLPNSAFSPNVYHYVWTFGDGTSSTVSTPAHAYNSMLPVVACCEYYDTANTLICTACDTVFLHTTVNCSFSATNTGGNSFVFQSQGVTGGLISWDFGDNTLGTGDPITHLYTLTGQLTVTMTVTDTMTSVILCTSTQTVTVGTSNTCTFTASNTPSAPLTYSFMPTGSAAVSYMWDFGDGSNSSAPPPYNHTYNSPGVYLVCLTTVNVLGATCQWCQPIQVGTSGSCSYTYISDPNNINGLIFSTSSPFINNPAGWDFGDGTVGTGNTITHVFPSPGAYYVCMIQRDSIGAIICTYCDSVLITGTNNCFFSFAPDSNTVNGFTFAGSPAYITSTLNWDFGDGSSGTGNTITHAYAFPGAYTVCMYELDQVGTIICSSCNTVVVSNSGNCLFTYLTDSINPLTIDFQANGGIGATVTWDFGDGSTGTGNSVSHTYNVPGAYQVCITVGVLGTVNCTFCDMVFVGNAGQCSITYYPDPFNTNTYIFNSAVSSATTSIQWTFGDGTAGAGQSVTHTYNAPGTYNVCITQWSLLQTIVCQSCTTITVSGVGPANCQASFLGVSNGLDAYFIDMSVINATPVIYTWDFGDNTTSSLQFPQHTYTLPGAYTVCLDINTGSCSDSYCTTIIIDSVGSNPGGSCNAFYATVQLAAYQVSIVNLSSGLNLSFDWDFGDGSPHDTNPYPSHYYTSTGSYNLCLTVSDGNGCSSTYCDTLNVDTLGNIYRTSSPGFTINVISPQQLIGVNEISSQKSFRAFPNPVTSELHVSIITGNDKAKEFRILSYQGAEILSGKLSGIEGNINTQSLSSGSYLLEITLTDGSRSFQSIIKQ